MMGRLIDAIPEYVLSAREVLGRTAILAVILFILGVVHAISLDTHSTWEGTCTFEHWATDGDIGLVVDCGPAGERTVTDSDVVRRFMQHPGPTISCWRSRADTVRCDKPPTSSTRR